MLALLSVILVIVFSLIAVRVATAALCVTGLSRELARFQARSAFTGSGFTTAESEKVMRHPVRRRIIMILMLFGNAGIITVVASLVLSLMGTGQSEAVADQTWFRISLLVSGLLCVWLIAHSKWIDLWMSRAITRALRRWTSLEVRDYAGLLHLANDFAVAELQVEPDDWLADRRLAEVKLSDEGVLVLGVQKADHTYVGAPRGDTHVADGDTLVLYGPKEVLGDLDERRAGAKGNWAHFRAVDQQYQSEAKPSTDAPATLAMPA